MNYNELPAELNEMPVELNEMPAELNEMPVELKESPLSLNELSMKLNENIIKIKKERKKYNIESRTYKRLINYADDLKISKADKLKTALCKKLLANGKYDLIYYKYLGTDDDDLKCLNDDEIEILNIFNFISPEEFKTLATFNE